MRGTENALMHQYNFRIVDKAIFTNGSTFQNFSAFKNG